MARQSTLGTDGAPGPGAAPVLLTRPEAQSRAFAAALQDRFGSLVHPVIAPLMAVRYLRPALPDGSFAGVILTSASAVAAAERLGADLPGLAFCVGAKTAAEARAAGFQTRSADGDADALVALLIADPPAGRLLHLRGADSRGDVAERLSSAGIETVSAIVYKQLPLPLSPTGQALLQAREPVILPLFSPRSAALFADALPPGSRADLDLVAISPAVAKLAARLPHRALLVAGRPDAAAMLDAVGLALERRLTP